MKLEQERFDWAMSRLSAAQVRATDARVRVVRCLAGQSLPVTMDDVCAVSGVRNQCDPATVWRTLDMLEDLEIVRQIRLSDRHSYFALNAPGDSCDYLVCRKCGIVAGLPVASRADRQRPVRREARIGNHPTRLQPRRQTTAHRHRRWPIAIDPVTT